jgi:hypothetical protein
LLVSSFIEKREKNQYRYLTSHSSLTIPTPMKRIAPAPGTLNFAHPTHPTRT